MSKRELIASGITDPEMQESYERCRKLNSKHGKTYYLATLLLPQAKDLMFMPFTDLPVMPMKLWMIYPVP